MEIRIFYRHRKRADTLSHFNYYTHAVSAAVIFFYKSDESAAAFGEIDAFSHLEMYTFVKLFEKTNETFQRKQLDKKTLRNFKPRRPVKRSVVRFRSSRIRNQKDFWRFNKSFSIQLTMKNKVNYYYALYICIRSFLCVKTLKPITVKKHSYDIFYRTMRYSSIIVVGIYNLLYWP